MIITDKSFGPNIRIEKDPHQYIVQKRSVYKGKEIWKAQGYYSTIGGAITRLVIDKIVEENDVLTLQEYVALVESSITSLIKRLNY